ncbi:hypothetical protein ABFS83_12G076600 [Erythranthe nasuta]
MEELSTIGHHNPNNKPNNSLSKMNISNMEVFSNLASSSSMVEGFNSTFHNNNNNNQGLFSDHHHNHLPPMAFISDEIPRSVGPVFDPTAHFFASGNNGCINNMSGEPEIVLNLSPSVSGTGFLGHGKVSKNHQEPSYGGKKRKRVSEREMEKPREVVHVRAKRGQATDSHSLAERLRREKINDKLRCLQDLVPGCYKTMGMAVMLDVIINYVRSLQNQIDFLSMKLSAASLFYDFNSSDAEAMEALQGTNGYEAVQMVEKLVGEGYGGISQFQAPWSL